MKRIKVTEQWPESWQKMLAIEPTKLEQVEAKLDGKKDWDRAEMEMVLKFYELIGFDKEEEVLETNWDEMGSLQAGKLAKQTAGIVVWLGEEQETIWRDGILLGTMLFCRSSREVELADGRRFINWGEGCDGSWLRQVQ